MRANLMQVTKHVIERVLLNTVLVVAILSVLGCGPPGTAPRESVETPSAPVEGTPLAYEAVLCINEARINVLVADTPQERAAGLSGYAGLPENVGMLFVFPEPRQPSFWMKGMEFPSTWSGYAMGLWCRLILRFRPHPQIRRTTNSRATTPPNRSPTCWN